MPEVVRYEENGVDAVGIDYARPVALLIEAVKEQKKTLDSQQAEINSLKALIAGGTGGTGDAGGGGTTRRR